MTKESCLQLILKNFNIESCVSGFNDLDLNLNSRIFYYFEMFKGIRQIKLIKVSSKCSDDNIIFNVYFHSEDFGGLSKGFFKIIPETQRATDILEYSNKVCYNLGDYFYDLFNNNELFKLYLISNNFQTALETRNLQLNKIDFNKIKKYQLSSLSNYHPDIFNKGFLNNKYILKYISDFYNYSSDVSNETKRFLLNILTYDSPFNYLLLNGKLNIPYTIKVTPKNIILSDNKFNLPLYYFYDQLKRYHMTLFVKLEFNFGGVFKN